MTKSVGIITFVMIVLAIVASTNPSGNAIVAFYNLTGVRAAILWVSIAMFAGGATALAYYTEKRYL